MQNDSSSYITQINFDARSTLLLRNRLFEFVRSGLIFLKF